jgi:uncharacterized protein YbaR (Trm112 family)
MAVSPFLLSKIVCPSCHEGAMKYEATQDRLVCHSCKLGFRVKDDVPVLLLDEAEKIG